MASSAQSAPASTPEKALAATRRWYLGVGIFSAAVNILMLTGSLYMLQVYDRVLSSRSVSTLVALSVLALLAFAVQAMLDSIRVRMLVHIGAAYERALAPQVFDAVTGLALGGFTSAQAMQPARDAERVRTFLGGLGPTALLDMPFMPMFMLGCFILHPWLGGLALAGGVLIIGMAVAAELISRRSAKAQLALAQDRNSLLEACRRSAEAMIGMGFRQAMRERWQDATSSAIAESTRSATRTARAAAWAKAIRMILQSAMLGLGGYLAIEQQITSGAIIAASIIMSRALAPIEVAIGHWRLFVAARESHNRLKKLVRGDLLARGKTELPAPRQGLTVDKLVVATPGETTPVVKGVSFALNAGSALAVFGPSAAGKSSMARALVGVWRSNGDIRLDGAGITQYPETQLSRVVGYLPQDVELLDGTIRENIARFSPDATDAEVVAAAKTAGAHEVITRLQAGYDTRIGEGGMRLSGGQRQRVALARALFRDPFLVILDEPNSNLDGSGDHALNEAVMSVRARGGVVIVISHRTATIAAVDHVAVMNDGRFEEFGPREQIMPRLIASNGSPRVNVGQGGPARPGTVTGGKGDRSSAAAAPSK